MLSGTGTVPVKHSDEHAMSWAAASFTGDTIPAVADPKSMNRSNSNKQKAAHAMSSTRNCGRRETP